jgi:hypothetical protein
MNQRPRPGRGETLRLDVADRTNPAHPTTVTVTIPAGCPTCGATLGRPTPTTVYDCCSGQELTISMMTNPCGHALLHRDALAQANQTQTPETRC